MKRVDTPKKPRGGIWEAEYLKGIENIAMQGGVFQFEKDIGNGKQKARFPGPKCFVIW
jgi:hypothetical protein